MSNRGIRKRTNSGGGKRSSEWRNSSEEKWRNSNEEKFNRAGNDNGTSSTGPNAKRGRSSSTSNIPSSNRTGSTSSAPYSNRSTARNSAFSKRKETNIVEISNLANRNEQELLQALAKYAEFTPVETLWSGNNLIITCANSKEAFNLKKAHGSLYNGLKIVTRFVPIPNTSAMDGKKQGSDLIESLTRIIQQKYDANQRYLDLEAFTNEAFKQDPSQTKFGQVLCKLIGSLCPDVVSISFASNHISSLEFFSDLFSHIPKLENVSFQNNNLKNIDDLRGFRGKDFTLLRELILDGNPIMTKVLSKPGSETSFLNNMKKLFPTLKILDGQAMPENIVETMGSSQGSSLPLSVKSGFSDSPESLGIAQMFLLKFYELFDTNRDGLSHFYEDSSCFSLHVADSIRKDQPSPELLFKQWWPFQRSLSKVIHTDKRIRALHYGWKQIMTIFTALPPTQHPLHEPPEKKKFLFDIFQHGVEPNVFLYIFVHGELSISQGATKRSFDRTFILVPAAPGSRAAQAGSPVSIVNDILSLRPFSDNHEWKNAQDLNAASLQQTLANLPDLQTLALYQSKHNLDNVHHAQVVQFAQMTGLNYGMALQCLSEMQWSNERAFEAFTNAKSQIPPEAFRI